MPIDEGKTSRNVFIILLVVGLVLLLIGSALSIKMLIFDKEGKKATYATIVELGESSTTVKYAVNNRIYTKRYNSYSSSYYVGKRIKVYYNKVNPNKSYIANLQYLILILPGIGLLLLSSSGIGLLHTYFKYYKLDA